MAVLEFGRFGFDTVDQTLLDCGERLLLTPTEAALLGVMLRSRGTVVTHAALLTRVWPGVHVSPATVTRQVSRLRSRLGDSSTRPTIIGTVSRRGYRLLVQVRHPVRESRQLAPLFIRSSVLPIALLPLTGASDDLANLALGLTERLIDRLSSLPDSRVIGLASVLPFARGNAAPAEVMARLSAGSVMTGTLRTEGAALVASLELIAADSTRLWASQEHVPRQKLRLLEGRLARSFAHWFAPPARGGNIGQPRD